MKLNAFRLTVSTPDPLFDDAIGKIHAYCVKKCHFYHIVTEYGANGKKHLHAAIVVKAQCEGFNLVSTIFAIVRQYHPTSIRKYAVNVHAMYDHGWYDEYLSKEEEATVVATKYDRDEVAKFFPTEAEQTALMAHVVEGTDDAAKDKYLSGHEKRWIEYEPDQANATFLGAVEYLNYSMNVERSINVILDPRRLNQLAWGLYKYRNKIYAPDVVNIRYQHIMEGTLADNSAI